MNNKTMPLVVLLILFTLTGHAETCMPITQGASFALSQCDRLKVLVVKGTPVERARIHGQLMKKEMTPAVIQYFAGRMMRDFEDRNFILKAAVNGFYNWWVHRLLRPTPENLREELRALGEGAGIDEQAMERAVTMPDAGTIVAGIPAKGFFDTLTTFGCTSVARTSPKGNFVYARNLEFGGVGYFDKYPLMTIQIPEDGSKELRHITFGAEGVQWGGITGVNEAGIGFAVHQIVAGDADRAGVPMLFIGDLVLRQAHNLDEAIAIIDQNRPGPMWTFVLTDLNAHETRTVEVSSHQLAVRKMEDGALVQTNHLLAAEKSKEVPSYAWRSNSEFRVGYAKGILKDIQNPTAESLIQILSHQQNANGDFSVSHDVMKGATIQTVVMEQTLKSRTIFMSIDEAPAASGRFAAFAWDDLLKASAATLVSFTIKDLSHTPAEVRRKQQLLSRAAQYFDRKEFAQAADLFKEQNTFESQIFRAVALYRAHQYQESLKLVDANRISAATSEFKGSWEWIEMMDYFQQENKSAAQKIASQALQDPTVDPDFKSIATKIAAGDDLKDYEKNMTYSLFGGRVTNSLF